jgi:hypothetical protein
VDHFRLASYAPNGGYIEGGYLLMPNQLQPGLLAGSIPLLGNEHATWMRQMRRIGSTIGWIDDHPDELGRIELNADGSPKIVYPYGPTTQARCSQQVFRWIRASPSWALVTSPQSMCMRLSHSPTR